MAVANLDPIGGVSTTEIDPLELVANRAVSYNGDAARGTFDAFGRPLARFFQPSGQPEVLMSETGYFDHDPSRQGAPIQAFVESFAYTGNGAESVRSAMYLDGFGAVARSVNGGPDGLSYVGVRTIRDPENRTTITTDPYDCGSDAHCTVDTSERSTTRVVDALGRPTLIVAPVAAAEGQGTRIVYGPTDSGGIYDAVLTRDPTGILTRQLLDGDRLVFLDECENTSPSFGASLSVDSCVTTGASRTFYRYEPGGQLEAIFDPRVSANPTDQNATLRYVFDSRGRVTTSYDVNKQGPETSAYDAFGQVVQSTNAAGETVTAEYDALGRPTLQTDQGAQTRRYELDYDPVTRQVSEVRQIAAQTISTKTFAYDAFGRLAQNTLTLNQFAAPTLVMEYDYDRLGRQTAIRYPDENTELRYEYEGAGLAAACEPGSAGTCADPDAVAILTDVAYDAVGRVSQIHGGVASPTSAIPFLEFTYDTGPGSSGLLSRLRLDTGEADIDTIDLAYTYDAAARIQGIDDSGHVPYTTASTLELDSTYTYDHRGRIASTTRQGGAASHFTYDATGNVVQRGAQTLEWDPLGRLVRITSGATTTEHIYDLAGIRIASSGTTTKAYMGNLFEIDLGSLEATAKFFALGRQVAYKRIESATLRQATGSVAWHLDRGLRYLPMLLALLTAMLFSLLLVRSGGLLAVQRRPAYSSLVALLAALLIAPPPAWAGFTAAPGSGTFYRWVWQAPAGTGTHITTAEGYGVHQRQFEPFGSLAAEDSSEPTPQTFGTHELDEDSGLYYMQQRWYDPIAGRFLSVDPVVRNPGAPAAVNGYSYVENDPVNAVDPTGEAPRSMPLAPPDISGEFGLITNILSSGRAISRPFTGTGFLNVISFSGLFAPSQSDFAPLRTRSRLRPMSPTGIASAVTRFGAAGPGISVVEGLFGRISAALSDFFEEVFGSPSEAEEKSVAEPSEERVVIPLRLVEIPEFEDNRRGYNYLKRRDFVVGEAVFLVSRTEDSRLSIKFLEGKILPQFDPPGLGLSINGYGLGANGNVEFESEVTFSRDSPSATIDASAVTVINVGIAIPGGPGRASGSPVGTRSLLATGSATIEY